MKELYFPEILLLVDNCYFKTEHLHMSCQPSFSGPVTPHLVIRCMIGQLMLAGFTS